VDTPNEPAASPDEERVPVNFVIPIGMTSRYAQHVIVQASDLDVTLSFFEMKPPIVLGNSESQEKAKEAALRDGINAECVARVTPALDSQNL